MLLQTLLLITQNLISLYKGISLDLDTSSSKQPFYKNIQVKILILRKAPGSKFSLLTAPAHSLPQWQEGRMCQELLASSATRHSASDLGNLLMGN